MAPLPPLEPLYRYLVSYMLEGPSGTKKYWAIHKTDTPLKGRWIQIVNPCTCWRHQKGKKVRLEEIYLIPPDKPWWDGIKLTDRGCV